MRIARLQRPHHHTFAVLRILHGDYRLIGNADAVRTSGGTSPPDCAAFPHRHQHFRIRRDRQIRVSQHSFDIRRPTLCQAFGGTVGTFGKGSIHCDYGLTGYDKLCLLISRLHGHICWSCATHGGCIHLLGNRLGSCQQTFGIATAQSQYHFSTSNHLGTGIVRPCKSLKL